MRLPVKATVKQVRLLVFASLATVVLSTVALLDFYAQNAHELEGPARVIRYAENTLLIVALAATLVKACLPKIPLWRVILMVGIGVFVFYSYGEFKALEKSLNLRTIGRVPFLWVALSVAAALVALVLLRRPASVPVLLILSIAFAAPSIVRVLLMKDHHSVLPAPDDRAAVAKHPRISPNIYWIVLDGYPRRDVLQQRFGYNNSRFLNSLETLGFVIVERSLSNFPATINSISSTLNMDYTIRPDGNAIQAFALRDMYPIVKGKSRTVSRLKAAGYNYVHFENGYDNLTKCADDERRCIHGREGLDEQDVAILSNTPIIDLIARFEADRSKTDATPIFDIGGVEDLTATLQAIQEAPAPFFVYAHILAPHPPIRFRADCSLRPAEPDLQVWSAKARPDFIEQLKCVNVQAETLMKRIASSDPPAVIILQSDHGTAFNGQFAKKPADWSDSDLQERFGVLNAIRLATPCRSNIMADLTLVDTFPLVFSCLTGEEFKPHPPRFFVTPYDNSPDLGQAVEYASSRLRRGS